MFVLPLVILVSTYVSTIITIARSEKVFKAESGAEEAGVRGAAEKRAGAVPGAASRAGRRSQPTDVNRCRLMRRAKIKSLRISVVIVVAFVVWWTPYYTMMIIFIFLNPDKHLSEELQSGIFFFGMSNSLVNPLIYGAFHLWRPGGHKSSYRSTGCNSVNFSREGSTRRSTATNVSFMNRAVSRKRPAGCPPRILGEEDSALVSAPPDGTPLQHLDAPRPRLHRHHHHHSKGRSGRHRSASGSDGKVLIVSSHRRKSRTTNGVNGNQIQRDDGKLNCDITIDCS